MVGVPASRLLGPGSNLGPAGASPQCGLWGGRSHYNTVKIVLKKYLSLGGLFCKYIKKRNELNRNK